MNASTIAERLRQIATELEENADAEKPPIFYIGDLVASRSFPGDIGVVRITRGWQDIGVEWAHFRSGSNLDGTTVRPSSGWFCLASGLRNLSRP